MKKIRLICIIYSILFLVFYIIGAFLRSVTEPNQLAINTLLLMVLTTVSFIILIVFLILLQVYYNKYNKNRLVLDSSISSIYGEWLSTLLCIIAVLLLPVSLYLKTDSPRSDFIKSCRTVAMASILLPNNERDYICNDERENSLLCYNYSKSTLNSEDKRNQDIADIRSMLERKDFLAIKTVMRHYIALEKKNGIKSTLNEEDWFKSVYNPPQYPINGFHSHFSKKELKTIFTNYNEISRIYSYPQHLEYFDSTNFFSSNKAYTILIVAILISLIPFLNRFVGIKNALIGPYILGYISCLLLGTAVFLFFISIYQAIIANKNSNILLQAISLFIGVIPLIYIAIYTYLIITYRKPISNIILSFSLFITPFFLPTMYTFYSFFNDKFDDEKILNVIGISSILFIPFMFLITRFFKYKIKLSFNQEQSDIS